MLTEYINKLFRWIAFIKANLSFFCTPPQLVDIDRTDAKPDVFTDLKTGDHILVVLEDARSKNVDASNNR
jgi:hypothetical protein